MNMIVYIREKEVRERENLKDTERDKGREKERDKEWKREK